MSDYSKFTKPNTEKIRVSSLHTATADYADETIDGVVQDSLSNLRNELGMDVAFVSEFINGRRVFKLVSSENNAPKVGDSDTLEDTWCKYTVEGRMPNFMKNAKEELVGKDVPELSYDVGTYLSIPIVLTGGQVYGTLCCFSHSVNGQVEVKDLNRLQNLANMVARKVEVSQKNGVELSLA